jgi:hypothetical protein
MTVPLKHILIVREILLKEYAEARLNFLEKKKELETINKLLEDNGIKHFQHFNGNYDLWEFMYLPVTSKSEVSVNG